MFQVINEHKECPLPSKGESLTPALHDEYLLWQELGWPDH